MTTKQLITSAAIAIAAIAAPAASADGPAASCPPPFMLFAIPLDGSRPVATALDAAGNHDGYACEMPHPAGEVEHVGSPFNVIENRVPFRA